MNVFGQDLAQLNAPLVKAVNAPHGTTDKHAVLLQGNQRTQIEPMLLHSTYPKSVYSQALGIAFFELASKVHEEDEIISMIANYLSAHLEKYRISRGAALDLASKYLEKAIQHNFELNK